MAIRKAFLCLAMGAVATVLAGQGIVIQEKPAFTSAERFQTKGIVINGKFKTADGSVHPAGRYSFKVQGTGKAGEAMIIIVNSRTGKPVGNVMGMFEKALGGPDTKTSRVECGGCRNVRFGKLGFSSSSEVKLARQGNDFIVIVGGKQGKIRATLKGAAAPPVICDGGPIGSHRTSTWS
jgi:hypothetical protein